MVNTKYDKVKEVSIEDSVYNNKNAYKYALDMTLKELKQSVEGLFHNLNSLCSRSGAQLPFSSVNYGTCTLKEGQYIINAMLDGSLDGTGPDHRTAIFPCVIFQYDKDINGMPNTPNYPLFKKALYSCSKRIYPNFANCDWSLQTKGQKYDRDEKRAAIEMLKKDGKDLSKLSDWLISHEKEANNLSLIVKNSDINNSDILVADWNEQKPFEIMSTMGCRTYNAYDVNSDREFWYKMFDYIIENNELPNWFMWSANQKDGRGNICPVTIIMPSIAMDVVLWKKEREGNKENGENVIVSEDEMKEEFIKRLDVKIHEAKEMLLERFEIICSQSPSAAKLMWNNRTMYGFDGKDVRSAVKHGTLAIGQIGLAETLRLITGHDQTNSESMEFAKRIEKLFNDRCAEFKKEEHLNFGVYYTPAENLCKTSLRRFRDKYGVIENVSDQEFFTNSIHIPVYDEVDVFEKIKKESELTGYSTAGCITYVELDSEIENNTEAMEKIVNYAMNDCDIPYFAVNRNLSYCKKCGTKGDFKKCPNCGAEGSELEQLARVTGYLTTDVSNMNKGKQAEVSKRVKHTGCKIA